MDEKPKKAYLLSCSDHYYHRLFAMDTYLKTRGYETVYITGSFSHDKKTYFYCPVPHCVQLPTRAYRRNLSLARIRNHWGFARKAFDYLERLDDEPDAVVALLPPNFLAYYGARYKKKHPRTALVFDIFDLWPETMPSNRMKKLLALPFRVWRGLRDRHLDAADKILSECDLFAQRLGRPEVQTVYLAAQRPKGLVPLPVPAMDEWKLCYLGAINHIIDIPSIVDLIRQLAAERPVTLHIIGIGERQQEFVNAAQAAGAQVVFHGAVYDEGEKHAIISSCHFGLNMMKSAVCVGLTMKSVDYFKHGVPIINNIPADTARLVEEEGVGLNWDDRLAARMRALRAQDCAAMRESVERVFDEQFDLSVILRRYDALLRDTV